MRRGKLTALEPWLAPKDAFETLRDCHLKYGVLEKRRGYSFFGQILHINTSTKAPTLKTDPVMGIYNWYSGATEQLIVMDKKRLNKYLTGRVTNLSVTLTDAGGGEVNAAATAHGLSIADIVTISSSATLDATYAITWVDADNFKFAATWHASNSTGTADQEPFVDLTYHKIRFQHASKQAWTPSAGDVVEGVTSGAYGTIKCVIVDTGTFAGTNANGTIVFTNNSITGTFDEIAEELFERGTPANIIGNSDGAGTDDEFTGDNTNFYWVENWREISYISNNNDAIQKYGNVSIGSGQALSRLHIDLDVEAGPDNDVTRCLLIFVYKSRLIIFDTEEDGTTYRQRGRWCEIDDPDTWKNANYLDAPTDEWIIAGDFLGDDLVIWFERSVWKFSYTGDSAAPFRWDRIDSVEGCAATMSLISFSDEILGVGPTQLTGTDGREAYAIDKKIPEFSLTWKQNSVGYCYGLVVEEQKHALISYASPDATAQVSGDTNIYPDSALVLNTEDRSFSTYELPIHTLGYSKLESDLTWDEISSTWDDLDSSWDEKTAQAGYPTTLMGGHDGKIYKLNDGGTDDGSDIEFQAISSEWNPFIEQGYKARLGFIDFLVDVDANVSFSVKSYINTDSTAFQTKTITCTAVNGSTEMAWHRVYVNAVAAFHRIEMTNNASSQRPRIHAIMPWFERAGRLVA